MKKDAITVTNISKVFTHKEDPTSSIKSLLIKLVTLNFKRAPRITKVVLQNLTFTIHEGDFVGIMGRNGVGKSTFLKVLSNIYKPTSGSFRTFGKVVPLLELGAGFAGDLSGYENIFLNASILGFTKNEIVSKIDAIIKFSELKENIYRPVKNYSSGMLVRLAFSIASHVEADILFFDEILAVGDVGFQAKCMEKIKQLSELKKTIILVTHSPDSVKEFCNRCIVFNDSGVIYDGNATEGAKYYSDLF